MASLQMKSAAWIGLCAIALAAPSVRAQDADQSQQQGQQQQQQPAKQSTGPIPAFRSPLASVADNGDEENAQELTPDTTALSGAQNFTLGTPVSRSYWQPHFDISASADSNALETAHSNGWGAWTSISGGIDVHRTSGSNSMILSYISGGTFSSSTDATNGVIQDLSFLDKFAFRRWSLSVLDSLSYLPETSLGYGGLGGVSLPGGSSGLGSTFTPGQSILAGQQQNLGNSFAAEADTYLTPRSSLTLVGGDSVLHYFASDFLDFDMFSARAGYNYQMTRNDTLALSYTFSGIRYSNFNQTIDEHTAQLSYGRRVTGKLAFQIGAGPQIVSAHIPLLGGTASGGEGSPAAQNTTQLEWSLNTALRWQPNRNALGLSYSHSATGGSGVLAGAITDVVTGSVSRQVSRTFSDGISAGYSRNDGVPIKASTPNNEKFDYVFAGVSVTHPMGRALGLTFSYQMQYQTSNTNFCIEETCGTSAIRHLISVGVGWHERPLLF